MFAPAEAQVGILKKFAEREQTGQLDKLIKCKGNWKGYPHSPFINRNQVGIGDDLLPRSSGGPGSVSALFEVKDVNNKELDTRVVRNTETQTCLGYKCTDV